MKNHDNIFEKIFSRGIEKNKIILVNNSTPTTGMNIAKVMIFEIEV